MSLFVLDTGFEFVKLIAVNVRKILHFRYAADAYDPAGGDIESEVPADALLGLDLGQPFLPAGGDIEKKALSVETAGVVDQVRGDEYSAAPCRCLDQIDIIAIHDELAVGEPLFEAKAGYDLRVQVENALPEFVICRCGENAALGSKSVGQVKIESIADTCVLKFVVDGNAFYNKFTAGGIALDQDLMA